MDRAQSWPAMDRAAVDARAFAGLADGTLDTGLAQRVRIMGRLLGGTWVSGQDLAGELKISRSAVHKHVMAIRSSGVEVTSVRGSGYRLAFWPDALLPEGVLPLLFSLRGRDDSPGADTGADLIRPLDMVEIGLPYLYELETGSTNRVLREAAARDLPGGAVAVTDHQSEGRGRLGRRWVSEAGKDVTFSVLLRPAVAPEQVFRVVITTAVAVVESVRDVLGVSADQGEREAADRGEPARADLGPSERPAGGFPVVGLKWPNDVLVDGRKVCGILGEMSMDMDSLHWLVVGMGLNVNSHPSASVPAADLPPGRLPPVSLAEIMGAELPRGVVLGRMLDRLSTRLTDLAQGRWEDIRAAFIAADTLFGTEVTVYRAATGDIAATGLAAGIGDFGELLLRQPDGGMSAVMAGEVTVARQ